MGLGPYFTGKERVFFDQLPFSHCRHRSTDHTPVGGAELFQMLEGSWQRPSFRKVRLFYLYRGEASEAPPVKAHLVKSIS
jgi:hypothetical protein